MKHTKERSFIESFLDVDFSVESNEEVADEKKLKTKEGDIVKPRNDSNNAHNDYCDKTTLLQLLINYKKEFFRKTRNKKEFDKSFLKLHLEYKKIAIGLFNHHDFVSIPYQVKLEMLADAICRSLDKGSKETSKNIGIEYWIRFDEKNFDNVFAYWTQQIKTFYYQFCIKEKIFNTAKHASYQRILDQMSYDNINIYGCPSATHYALEEFEKE
jgi:hypothetical protein